MHVERVIGFLKQKCTMTMCDYEACIMMIGKVLFFCALGNCGQSVVACSIIFFLLESTSCFFSSFYCCGPGQTSLP